MRRIVLAFFVVFLASYAQVWAEDCVECHLRVTPKIVSDWRLSKHSEADIGCEVCHGEDHSTAEDISSVLNPTPDTCELCHPERVEQFRKGKHALAWDSMKAMPFAHAQPVALMEGQKGCGGCHKLGLKNDQAIKELKGEGAGFGLASCDACHTRHLFSVEEARQPQACQTCHMGFDHPQWEMYSSSKHGVRYLLKQAGVLPEEVVAPTCQTCHMQQGNHEVRTAWGFLAVRLPMPKDEQWAKDRQVILQGLGVLNSQGEPTARLELVKAADLARLTQDDWARERAKMLSTCHQCHSMNFVVRELGKGDEMIRKADHLMAEAIRIIAGLYEDGTLKKPESYAEPFPDLLAFHDAPTVIELELFEMCLKHRMRTFMGTFHSNPDYAFWYGWSEMQRDLTEIREMAVQLRAARD